MVTGTFTAYFLAGCVHSGVPEGEEGNFMVRGGYRPSQWLS